MNKLTFGFGEVDVDYPVQLEKGHWRDGKKREVIWRCPYHQAWLCLIRRCCSLAHQKRFPAYKGCSVDPRWKRLSSFITWVKGQPQHDDWLKGAYQLDKDFLLPGNRVYGPETCVLLPAFINNLFSGVKSCREHPLGVSYKKANKKYQAQIYSDGKKLYLGLYQDSFVGHQVWQKRKIEDIVAAVNRYCSTPDHNPIVVKRLQAVVLCLEEDLRKGLETKPSTFITLGENREQFTT